MYAFKISRQYYTARRHDKSNAYSMVYIKPIPHVISMVNPIIPKSVGTGALSNKAH